MLLKQTAFDLFLQETAGLEELPFLPLLLILSGAPSGPAGVGDGTWVKCSLSRVPLPVRICTRLCVRGAGYHCCVTNMTCKAVSAICLSEVNVAEEGDPWEGHRQMESKTALLRVPEGVVWALGPEYGGGGIHLGAPMLGG